MTAGATEADLVKAADQGGIAPRPAAEIRERPEAATLLRRAGALLVWGQPFREGQVFTVDPTMWIPDEKLHV